MLCKFHEMYANIFRNFVFYFKLRYQYKIRKFIQFISFHCILGKLPNFKTIKGKVNYFYFVIFNVIYVAVIIRFYLLNMKDIVTNNVKLRYYLYYPFHLHTFNVTRRFLLRSSIKFFIHIFSQK